MEGCFKTKKANSRKLVLGLVQINNQKTAYKRAWAVFV